MLGSIFVPNIESLGHRFELPVIADPQGHGQQDQTFKRTDEVTLARKPQQPAESFRLGSHQLIVARPQEAEELRIVIERTPQA